MLPAINPISALACFVVFIVYVLRDKIDNKSEAEYSATEKSGPSYPKPILRRSAPTPLQRDERLLDADAPLRTATYTLQKRSQMRDASSQHDDSNLSIPTAQIIHQPIPYPISVSCCQGCSHAPSWKRIKHKKKKSAKATDSPIAVENETLSSVSITATKRAQANKSLRDFITQISKEPLPREYENKGERKDNADSQSVFDVQTPNLQKDQNNSKNQTFTFPNASTPNESRSFTDQFNTFSKEANVQNEAKDVSAHKNLFEAKPAVPRTEKVIDDSKLPSRAVVPVIASNDKEKIEADEVEQKKGSRDPESIENSNEEGTSKVADELGQNVFQLENDFFPTKSANKLADLFENKRGLNTSMIDFEDKAEEAPAVQGEEEKGKKDPLEAFRKKGTALLDTEEGGSASFFKNANVNNDLNSVPNFLPTRGDGKSPTSAWFKQNETKPISEPGPKPQESNTNSSLFAPSFTGSSTPLFPATNNNQKSQPLFSLTAGAAEPAQSLFPALGGASKPLFGPPQENLFAPSSTAPLFLPPQSDKVPPEVASEQPATFFTQASEANPFIVSGNRKSASFLELVHGSSKSLFNP